MILFIMTYFAIIFLVWKRFGFVICVMLKALFHNISGNLLTTSGLSILMHGVISLPDTSFNKMVW